MSYCENLEGRTKTEYEITVPEIAILRHVCNTRDPGSKTTRLRVTESQVKPLPVWDLDSFYLANIGNEIKPHFLELRFAEASQGLWIALLMTNERQPRDLEAMAKGLLEKIRQRGIQFEAVIGVENSGSKISQEMARLLGPNTLQTTFQKGKPRIDDGSLVIGPPKEWVSKMDYTLVSSGTSGKAPQAIFLDRKIADVFGNKPTVIVDEARLTSGTINSSILLARKMGINMVAVATVLNEAESTENIDGTPYFNLIKLPVFTKDREGFHPIVGSFNGLKYFYQEIKNK